MVRVTKACLQRTPTKCWPFVKAKSWSKFDFCLNKSNAVMLNRTSDEQTEGCLGTSIRKKWVTILLFHFFLQASKSWFLLCSSVLLFPKTAEFGESSPTEDPQSNPDNIIEPHHQGTVFVSLVAESRKHARVVLPVQGFLSFFPFLINSWNIGRNSDSRVSKASSRVVNCNGPCCPIGFPTFVKSFQDRWACANISSLGQDR